MRFICVDEKKPQYPRVGSNKVKAYFVQCSIFKSEAACGSGWWGHVATTIMPVLNVQYKTFPTKPLPVPTQTHQLDLEG